MGAVLRTKSRNPLAQLRKTRTESVFFAYENAISYGFQRFFCSPSWIPRLKLIKVVSSAMSTATELDSLSRHAGGREATCSRPGVSALFS